MPRAENFHPYVGGRLRFATASFEASLVYDNGHANAFLVYWTTCIFVGMGPESLHESSTPRRIHSKPWDPSGAEETCWRHSWRVCSIAAIEETHSQKCPPPCSVIGFLFGFSLASSFAAYRLLDEYKQASAALQASVEELQRSTEQACSTYCHQTDSHSII